MLVHRDREQAQVLWHGVERRVCDCPSLFFPGYYFFFPRFGIDLLLLIMSAVLSLENNVVQVCATFNIFFMSLFILFLSILASLSHGLVKTTAPGMRHIQYL